MCNAADEIGRLHARLECHVMTFTSTSNCSGILLNKRGFFLKRIVQCFLLGPD